ncbi:MAG TPA: hypothetical protein VFQ91_09140 [Bryobacteraceae bacterium]|nr:hypothetical protein [Bryobacteraceae bacterium]
MFLALALLAGLPQADLLQSRFIGNPRAQVTQPRMALTSGGVRYLVHTDFDIASLETNTRIQIGWLRKLGPDDTVVWEFSLRGQAITAVAPGPQDSVYITGYDNEGGFLSRYTANKDLIWTRRLHGQPAAMASDAVGNVYLAGAPNERFTASPGAYQLFTRGTQCLSRVGESIACTDAFAAKYSPAGDQIFATFLGGVLEETANAVAAGPDGSIYIAGETMSPDFPVTPGAAQTQLGGVVTLGPLKFGDGYVVRLDPSGARLLYGSYLGGPLGDRINALAVDPLGNALAAGRTESDPLVMPGLTGDAFLARLDPAGRALVRTQFYTPSVDYVIDAVIGPGNRTYISLWNTGVYELNSETLQPVREAYVRSLAPASLAASEDGVLHLVTLAQQLPSNLFAVSAEAPRLGAAYLASFSFNTAARPYVSAITNAASYAMGRRFGGASIALSPNELISVFGFGFTADTKVLLNGQPLPVLYAGATQLNVRIPNETATGTASIAVQLASGRLGPWEAEIAPTVPALFATGSVAAAVNQDGTVNSATNPAPGGSIVQLFATGLGTLNANGRLTNPIKAYGGPSGQGLEILYAGEAPGLPGVQQVNVRMPPSAVPLTQPRATFLKLVLGISPNYEPTQGNLAIYIR